jgi:hypothetical protein
MKTSNLLRKLSLKKKRTVQPLDRNSSLETQWSILSEQLPSNEPERTLSHKDSIISSNSFDDSSNQWYDALLAKNPKQYCTNDCEMTLREINADNLSLYSRHSVILEIYERKAPSSRLIELINQTF